MEQKRFAGQLNYFRKQIEDNLASADLRFVNLEGCSFDAGVAATPINLSDFSAEEPLVVDQMLEPLILSVDGKIVRLGTVILRRKAEIA